MQNILKVKDVNDYTEKGKKYEWPKNLVKKCPYCKKWNNYIMFGFYMRYFINHFMGINKKIYIKRYLCKGCQKKKQYRTLSLLPDFCIKKFVISFSVIFKYVYKILHSKTGVKDCLSELNEKYRDFFFSKQQYYNYLNRFIKNINLIESFLRHVKSDVVLLNNNHTNREKVKHLLDNIKNEFDRLDNFLYTFFQITNKSPLTL